MISVPELASVDRITGNSYYCTVRQYPTSDIDCVSLKLTPDDEFRRGRGGVRKNTEKTAMDSATLAASRRRAASTIRRRSLCLNADRMLTLTFRDCVTDQAVAWGVFRRFNRLMKWRFPQWRYVAVQELQQRGAVHFHLAISGYYHVQTVRRFWLQAAGEFGGNVDIASSKKVAGKNSWSPRRIASYLAKYLTKTDIADFNKRRYSSGGDIPEPEKISFYVPYGLNMHVLFRKIIEVNSRLQVRTMVDLPGFYQTIYVSTS